MCRALEAASRWRVASQATRVDAVILVAIVGMAAGFAVPRQADLARASRAVEAARDAVEATPGAVVPPHLRGDGYRGARSLGHGVGYRYPHDYPGGVVPQQYLPDAAAGRVLYRPGQEGAEARRAERLAEVDRRVGRPPRE